MLSSIFVRIKTGLVCSAMLAVMIIAGCTVPDQQGQQPSQTQDKISTEIARYQSIIDAAHGEPSLDVIRAYIAQEPLVKESAVRQKNIDDTWQMLTRLSPQERRGLVINADENVLQGWLDLLSAYQDNKQDSDKLQAAIRDWKIRYPQNPAVQSLPTQLQPAAIQQQDTNIRIALFLPLSGQAKVFGEAIRQGFLDAQAGLPSPSLPTENPENLSITDSDSASDSVASTDMSPSEGAIINSAIPATQTTPVIANAPINTQQVKIYDTASQPLENLFIQAKQDGVNLIVGPLLKPDVVKLVQINTALNMLVLNELDNAQPHSNICYFSLSPEDEAKNAAEHIWQQQKQNPLILVPRGTFGDRIANAFAQEWQKQGGHTVLQQTFGSSAELKQLINRGTGIRLTGTAVNVTSNQPTSIAIGDLEIPQINTDVVPTSTGGSVDAVYIVSTLDELTLIKTMIDMAISSRNKPALYASSRSNQAGVGPDFRLEMEGMQFSDIPLIAGANLPLMQQAVSKFANDYSLMRLYAMGIDAWSLANQFSQVQLQSDFHLNGASGVLSVQENCTIFRQLSWMQYHQGQITAI
ncbi:penicillin-binding protein activator LpoA [Photorhabdus laumondii subsp. laumondii]|uniref:Penicillin-binding protein activator LpoA n=1 Tax=Photorhabdus laumondii subsp. laumondii TaxID=141679 RepID=A0A6L9JLI5_PHOLM|nr:MULTISPECIES: penicillin-binding protein activator [Photorhabdus]AWK44609.1 penicillin-binding protein activator LpoA [Photorhabdus laumondii subsp. laumondii]AXG45324.1 penicillin-binding protein activator LpoA [Photorhabdus laumondii subsp. laumondii]MCC8382543.1 penicillin-binding protein activator [Photorhabdus laumondii]MCC8387838.1 penicillin-binding protein activator [Photorhabdus laumondii]MCC8411424.1 penicillin-binding protein activator [Photorhabdus laumondii]